MRAADPDREIVALSGDYDFQFLIEELAVGAQYKLPYIHVVVNNSYLGLIRQAQRGFDMDYQVQLSFENINAPELGGYGVDHVAVAEGLGCKAIRVTDPQRAQAAFATAREWMAEYQVPVVVEFILERVTNISMGTEIDNIIEFEEVLDLPLTTRRHAAKRAAARCCRTDMTEGISTMPKFAANLTMLFGEMPFLDRFAAAKAAGFSGVEYLFPYDFDKAELREQLKQHGLTQVLFNLPAGNWAAASAASPSCRTGSTNSATASRARSTTPRRSAAGRSTAWPASRRRVPIRASWTRCWSTICASRPTRWRRSGSSC